MNPNQLKAESNIAVLIPVFNEEDNVEPIVLALNDVFKGIKDCNYIILFVDDGSTDDTLEEIRRLQRSNANISFLSFSRNFGKDAALMAGYQHLSGKINAVISIDADLQHPIGMIPEFIKQWQNGYQVVYAYREPESNDSRNISSLHSRLFYWTISKLADVKLENGLSDFKLVDRKVLKEIKKVKEDNPFLRGLIKWVGFKQLGIPYKVGRRLNGESKYSRKALVKLALNSITSFSTKPLTFAIYIGFFTSFIAILYLPYVLYSLYEGYAITGWASTIATIAFFGGIQLIVLGIIGLYLGKIFMQSKERPGYIINEAQFTYPLSPIPKHEESVTGHMFNF